jgi:hypothetical protein
MINWMTRIRPTVIFIIGVLALLAWAFQSNETLAGVCIGGIVAALTQILESEQ